MHVGIVGAGITGLALTHFLRANGIAVTTFEAEGEPGGVIQSQRVDGTVLEHGPQRLRLTDSIETLVDDLGLTDQVVTADPDLPLYVFQGGRLREVPRSLRAFLRTDLLSWSGKARMFWEPFTDPIHPQEHAAEAFTRKFGTEAYERVIEPLYGGMYGSDPHAMPAAHALDRIMALEQAEGSLLRAAIGRVGRDNSRSPPATFRDGLQSLPSALYDAHQDCIHLGTPVTGIAQSAPSDGVTVRSEAGPTDVDRVVLTSPASTTAQLLAPLDAVDTDPLTELRYNSLVIVHLSAPVDRAGFGYQVARDADLRTLGVTWNDSLFDRDGLYTAFLGGMWDPGAVDRDSTALAATATKEFREVLGVTPDVIGVTKLRQVMPAFDDSWRGLSTLELPTQITLATNYTGHVGIPSRIREARRIADRMGEDVPT